MLSVFAMLACFGIAFVTAIGPAAGSRASAYYRPAGPAPAKNTVQHYRTSAGVIDLVYTQGRWTVVEQPKPAAAESGSSKSTSKSKSGSGSSDVSTSVTVPSGTSQAYAAQRVAAKGWDSGQFSCLVKLWNRESGWRVNAANPSGAFGIPQALPGSKMGAGWQTDYKVQINWGLGYIAGSYGSPCGAWAHSNAFNWY